MAERKTRLTGADVGEFLDGVENPKRREDARAVMEMMGKVTKLEPEMWGPSIIGFDTRHYKYKNGSDAATCKIGFSPRAQSLVLYLGSFDGRARLLSKLGKHRVGNGARPV